MFQPQQKLAHMVQAIWSATVKNSNETGVEHWLQSDACSGIIFNLGSDIYLDDVKLPSGVSLLPISKHAQKLTLTPGAHLCGLRFHSGVSFNILGELYQKITPLGSKHKHAMLLQSLYEQLKSTCGHYANIVAIYKWLGSNFNFSNLMPNTLNQSLNALQQDVNLALLSNNIPISQRQLERQFKKQLGLTPKHYQRILRIKKTVNDLKHNPNQDLVSLALNHGFTDQSHMTREFSSIAKITPKKYARLVQPNPIN